MENAEDLKKYFDSKQYNTTIIGKTAQSNEESLAEKNNNEDKIKSIISLFTDPSHKHVKEETLLTLKKENAGELLLQAIANPASLEYRSKLVAACWESEINFSNYLLFFILLALDNNYLISIEAITTIEQMEGPFKEKDIKDAIKQVKAEQKKIPSEKAVLLNDLIVTLERFSNNSIL